MFTYAVFLISLRLFRAFDTFIRSHVWLGEGIYIIKPKLKNYTARTAILKKCGRTLIKATFCCDCISSLFSIILPYSNKSVQKSKAQLLSYFIYFSPI